MHLGNIFSALMSWLAAKSSGGRWLLRIEDLDPQRSRLEYARQIEDDLRWLGLHPDEGGLDNIGTNGPYRQSQRHYLYARALEKLRSRGLTYPCFCTRADIRAASAPHASDGRSIYNGKCRPASLPALQPDPAAPHATRLWVGREQVTFTDLVCGSHSVPLDREFGDIVLCRADGAWAYQLAVVVDDALMGVTQVVRGGDLLLSAAPQIYLHRLLGFRPPEFAHIPLLVNESGIRLSKRDSSLSMEHLRNRFTSEQLTGLLAYLGGLTDTSAPVSAAELLPRFSFAPLRRRLPQIPVPASLFE